MKKLTLAMKYLVVLQILFFNFSCLYNPHKEEERRERRESANGQLPLFLLQLAGQRIRVGKDPNCGGEFNALLSNSPVFPRLQENQEITSSYSNSIDYEYQSTKDSNITITILEKIKIDTSSSINCSNSNNMIGVGFCNESKITGYMNSDYFTYKFAIGQIYSKSFPGGVKYFIGIDSGEKECNLKVNLKSNTL